MVANIGADRDSVRVEGNEITTFMTLIGLKSLLILNFPSQGGNSTKETRRTIWDKDMSPKPKKSFRLQFPRQGRNLK